ncbi:helix-turn-helix domain-containing protein [Ramlibacter sp. XY19]|uniref:helix-turn-helix domain-containing protein n=1 Tax=Ramlibacter paludis TaxID=2908000 RepID=UPI0023DB1D4D|nr:helix-turn-helix domain-containing protein [Ramlibacter paludis]MCG2592986.1 helix-turn-helix domain-containing protein [Ramlibacter paludis]
MPNVASVLKDEIARVARKELRAEIEPLKRASAQNRSSIAALKREIASLQKQLRKSARSSGASQERGGEDSDGPRRRFSATRLAAHRKKLGLSAAEYGKLAGVSGQSVYKWEQGSTRPRASQLESVAEVRALGKREARARLVG